MNFWGTAFFIIFLIRVCNHFFWKWRRRKIVAAKESMVVVTEKNSNVKPITNFRGRAVRKFSYSDGDERIERNMTTEVKGDNVHDCEEHEERRVDEIWTAWRIVTSWDGVGSSENYSGDKDNNCRAGLRGLLYPLFRSLELFTMCFLE